MHKRWLYCRCTRTHNPWPAIPVHRRPPGQTLADDRRIALQIIYQSTLGPTAVPPIPVRYTGLINSMDGVSNVITQIGPVVHP